MLDNVNMDQLMSMALTNRKVVEFSQEDDPFAQNKDKIVKITGKRGKKKSEDAVQREEREREIKVLLSQPDQTDMALATKLAKQSRLQAKEVSNKDMAKLRMLRDKAEKEESSSSSAGTVKLSGVINAEVP